MDYFADTIPADLASRVHLYLCNGQDIDILPDPDVPYDLVVVRGVYTHFLPEVFEQSVAQVPQRLAPNGVLLISDQLYKTNNVDFFNPLPVRDKCLSLFLLSIAVVKAYGGTSDGRLNR